jgi:hypothetical protein
LKRSMPRASGKHLSPVRRAAANGSTTALGHQTLILVGDSAVALATSPF